METSGFLIKNKEVLVKPKILIADDSLTIQKVIKITLANENYELIECVDDHSLMDIVTSEKPNIILLDFNLSETKTGYDLVKEINAKCSAKTLMMYGTFDTVEDSLLDSLGVTEHLVKPFDGNKFIASCRRLAEDSAMEVEETQVDMPDEIEEVEMSSDDLDYPEPIEKPQEMSRDIFADDPEDEQWVVNQPDVMDDEEETADEIISKAEMNQLEAGIQDWGMDVPGVIGQAEVAVELPPVIEDTSFVQHSGIPEVIETQNLVPEKIEEDEVSIEPNSADLEYPDVDNIRLEVENTTQTPTLELTPLSELNPEPVEDNSFTGKTIGLDETEGTNTEEEVKHLEAQIADELEEDDDEDLWAADEVDPSVETEEEAEVEEEVAMQESDLDYPEPIAMDDITEADDLGFEPLKEMDDIPFEKVDAVKEGFNQTTIEPAFEPTPQQAAAQVDLKDLEAKIKEMISPMIEEMVKEHIQKSIDKVAWEVIPDLAENLIKKELKSISEQILK